MADYLPAIMNLAESCARLGVREAVLSPGSRNAPLIVAFSRHPQIAAYSIVDERVAAFVALGMAQQLQRPVVLICTSGTAALNYASALAEAFYLQQPLIVLTADRPPEWLGQQDGQTIEQRNIYQWHVKHGYMLPLEHSHADARWQMERDMAEAVNLALSEPMGPVHLNVPLREPLYPEPGQTMGYGQPKVITQLQGRVQLDASQWQALRRQLPASGRVLLLAGQQAYSAELIHGLTALKLPVLAEVISNLHGLPGAIRHADLLLSAPNSASARALQPDLLISFGMSILSKNLKQFLRINRPAQHWHLQPAGAVADCFQSLTQVIRIAPEDFFTRLANDFSQPSAYLTSWQQLQQRAEHWLPKFFASGGFNEFVAVQQLLSQLPLVCDLHLGNSMAVRYANLCGVQRLGVRVFANRGTSGIDGCMSTAVGHALSSQRLQLLLLGDLSFFYDSNALWLPQLPDNLRIVLLNNQGGGIFDLLPGAGRLPEKVPRLQTPHQRNARHLANDYGVAYRHCNDEAGLRQGLSWLMQSPQQIRLLEIQTDIERNSAFFKCFKQAWGEQAGL